MRRETSGYAREGGFAGDDGEEARRARLSVFTWRGLAGAVALLAVGAAMVGEEPEPIGRERRHVELAGHSGLVDTLRFSADGRSLMSSGWDRTVRVWDIDDSTADFGAELARLSMPAEIYSSAISPDGRIVAVAGRDDLALWDWAESGEVRHPSRPIRGPRALAFAPDGALLAVGGYDNRIYLVDVATGRVEAELAGHRDVIRKVAFTPDAGRLLSVSFDGRVKTWDVAARAETAELAAIGDEERPVQTFALAPDGKTLALSRLGNTDGRFEIRDLADGSLRATCAGAWGEVHSLAFSRDGAVLASCGADLKLRFWNPATGRAAGVMEGPLGWIRTLDFSADGRWIATSTAPDEVRLRRVDLPRRRVAPAAAI